MSCMSVLEDKLNRLNESKQACDEAGLAEDFKNAALSAHVFTVKCLAFVNARGDSDEATHAIVSQYKEATSNLITLTNSANVAGINLHGERNHQRTDADNGACSGLAILDPCIYEHAFTPQDQTALVYKKTGNLRAI